MRAATYKPRPSSSGFLPSFFVAAGIHDCHPFEPDQSFRHTCRDRSWQSRWRPSLRRLRLTPPGFPIQDDEQGPRGG